MARKIRDFLRARLIHGNTGQVFDIQTGEIVYDVDNDNVYVGNSHGDPLIQSNQLSELIDVELSISPGPQNGDFLIYDDTTSPPMWRNVAVAPGNAILIDNGDGTYTFDNGSSPNTIIDTNASSNPYDSTNISPNPLTATNVQDAIDQIVSMPGNDPVVMIDNGDGTYTFDNGGSPDIVIDTNASSNPYDPTSSGSPPTLISTNVQDAINELATRPTGGTLVDNSDGTYTFDDGTSPNVVVDTNADSNPYDNTNISPNSLTASNVQDAIDELETNKVEEAPIDSNTYVRRDGDWSAYVPSPIGGIEMSYRFQNTTTATDPGAGNVQVNNGDQTLASELYVSELSMWGNNLSVIWQTVYQGEYLGIWEMSGNREGVYYQVSGAITDNGGWYTIPVTFLPGTAGGIDDNRTVSVFLINDPVNKLPDDGLTRQALVKASNTSFDTEWSFIRLDELEDVNVTGSPGPQNGDALIYDTSISPPQWIPGAVASSSSSWTMINANTTANAGDQYMVDATTGDITVTLPVTPTDSDTIRLRLVRDGGALPGNILIVNSSGDPINDDVSSPAGVTTVSIIHRDVEFVYLSGSWWVNRYDLDGGVI